MKVKEFLAKEFARTSDRGADTVEKAYLAGFEKMRELVVGHFEDLHAYNPRGGYHAMAILVGAFGKAEVDPITGKQDMS